jgi:hypothetical protein
MASENLFSQAMETALKMDDLREERARAKAQGFEFLEQDELDLVEARWRVLHDKIILTPGGEEFLNVC